MGFYYTFLGGEAAESLREYIEFRKAGGWTTRSSDPIFVTDGQADYMKGKPITIQHVEAMMKRVASRSGIDPKTIWPHCLRKSFRKVLNNAPIDEDTKTALMGHCLPGSRGNYFDYHDISEVARKYMQADFSRNTGSQHDALRHQMERMGHRLDMKIARLEKLPERIRKDYDNKD